MTVSVTTWHLNISFHLMMVKIMYTREDRCWLLTSPARKSRTGPPFMDWLAFSSGGSNRRFRRLENELRRHQYVSPIMCSIIVNGRGKGIVDGEITKDGLCWTRQNGRILPRHHHTQTSSCLLVMQQGWVVIPSPQRIATNYNTLYIWWWKWAAFNRWGELRQMPFSRRVQMVVCQHK